MTKLVVMCKETFWAQSHILLYDNTIEEGKGLYRKISSGTFFIFSQNSNVGFADLNLLFLVRNRLEEGSTVPLFFNAGLYLTSYAVADRYLVFVIRLSTIIKSMDVDGGVCLHSVRPLLASGATCRVL